MKALIVGGGIAGPVAALALRKAGIDSTVFESHASTADGVGGVLMVAPNGLNALRIIGANAVVRAIGQPVRRMAMADGSGKRFGEFAGLPGLPDSLVMWRADLNRVLHDLAVARGIRVEYGKRLVDVVESRTGISAHFTDGSTESADVL
ncbi:MAG: FAD-dependent oxidoreductase, partial [Steroidobacterales bacterium]